jgi:epoxyqueuosine reductase
MKTLSFEDIRHQGLSLGWDDIGMTKAIIPHEDIIAYEKWVERKGHAKLTYMENANRCDPQKLLPGAKTAIMFISYYKQTPVPFEKEFGVVASYARGRDYHHLHRKRLKKFIQWLEEEVGTKGIAKGFSDSSPLLEKALAVQAGLGWLGKNTLLIHRRFGTFTLLSGILTTLEFTQPMQPAIVAHLPRCGSCTRCIDACPTGALSTPYQLDATRCLSYHLIESKEEIPSEIQRRNPGYIFGCDICQDVCPHNQRKPSSTQAAFSPDAGVGIYLSGASIAKLEREPERLFGTPLQRRGVVGLKHTFDTLTR